MWFCFLKATNFVSRSTCLALNWLASDVHCSRRCDNSCFNCSLSDVFLSRSWIALAASPLAFGSSTDCKNLICPCKIYFLTAMHWPLHHSTQMVLYRLTFFSAVVWSSIHVLVRAVFAALSATSVGPGLCSFKMGTLSTVCDPQPCPFAFSCSIWALDHFDHGIDFPSQKDKNSWL